MGWLPFSSALCEAVALFIILLFISSASTAKCCLRSLLEAYGKKSDIANKSELDTMSCSVDPASVSVMLVPSYLTADLVVLDPSGDKTKETAEKTFHVLTFRVFLPPLSAR